jgi:DNA invertase Pin-like site-specific DNA recombinase
MAAPSSPTAYSYVRFSSKKQEEGDSIRRQTERTTAWASRQGVHLDTLLSIDRGVSAFRGKNRDLGSLAEFLRQVESGRVGAGSFLVVEALDRITREDIQPALLLILNLLQKGVRVVQLSPVEMVYTDKSDMTAIVLMIVELSRGHSESKVKSERNGAAWAQRRKKARAKTGLMTRKLPAWVKAEGDWLVVIPERAAVVRRVFEMSTAGYGLWTIMRRLTDEGVPAFGPSGRWSITYLDTILKDRRALGEYQPRLRGGVPDGGPITDYFPRIVSEADWQRARAGAISRHRKPGRTGAVVNVFQGLVRGAKGGSTYVVGTASTKNPHAVLRSGGPRRGVGRNELFPLETFERAVLSALREIDPREILDGDRPDDSPELAGRLAGVEQRITEVEAEMLTGDVPALARVQRTLDAQRKELAAALASARRDAANPLSEAWGEAGALLAAVGKAADPKEARLRLRSALRRIVETVLILVVPRGRDRLAFVQVYFTGGARRSYLIAHRPAHWNGKVRRAGRRFVTSWKDEGADDFGFAAEPDLSDPKEAARVEQGLLALPAEEVDGYFGPEVSEPT